MTKRQIIDLMDYHMREYNKLSIELYRLEREELLQMTPEEQEDYKRWRHERKMRKRAQRQALQQVTTI